MSANSHRRDIFRQDTLLTVKVTSKQNNLASVLSENINFTDLSLVILKSIERRYHSVVYAEMIQI